MKPGKFIKRVVAVLGWILVLLILGVVALFAIGPTLSLDRMVTPRLQEALADRLGRPRARGVEDLEHRSVPQPGWCREVWLSEDSLDLLSREHDTWNLLRRPWQLDLRGRVEEDEVLPAQPAEDTA